MNVYLVSLGCPKNWVDSELMVASMQAAGACLVDDASQADLILVNTCAFLQSAVNESVETILELARFKEEGHCRQLVVTGCLVQRYGAELAEALPEVDHFLGTNEFTRIGQLIGGTLPQRLYFSTGSYLYSARDGRLPMTPGGSAYLKVAEGCSRSCSFCLIPSLRGAQVSRDLDDVVAEARTLCERGIRELVLVAQDLTAYGLDLGRDVGLIQLLSRLEEVDGVAWIRLMYCYPHHFNGALIETIARSDKVLPYVDIPLQHTSDRILSSMRRNVTWDTQRRLVETLKAVEDMVLRTTFIVGYPGETEREFEDLYAWVKEMEFDRLGVFSFSPEEGTPAATLGDQVPDATKEERRDALMELQQGISLKINRGWIGRELEVLVEGVSEEHDWVLQGRHYGQAPEVDGLVYLSFDDEGEGMESGLPQPGEFVRVAVTEATAYDLVGRVVAV